MITRTQTLVRTLPPNLFTSFSTHPNPKDTLILSRLKHKDWLTPKETTTLLTSLTHPSSTLHFFDLFTSRKDFHLTESLSTTLITKLAQSQHLTPLLTLHQTLTKQHRFTDTLFFTLIKAYAHSFHRLDLALQTLRDMPSFHVTPSHRTFNLVLNALVNSRLFAAARELFLDAPRLGVSPDACSMNILIKGLCLLGDVDGAVRVVEEEFVAVGCVANSRSYATVMKGLCEVGRVGEAWGMLERMEREGVDVDAAVFNVLIGGLRREGRVGEGLRVLEGMMGRGVRPNGGSYNEVLCGLVEEGRVVEAMEVVERMEREGFVPSFEAYKGLVKGFCEKGRVGEVEWVVRDMVRKGFVPRMGMWRKIVNCVVERGENFGRVGDAIDGLLENSQLGFILQL